MISIYCEQDTVGLIVVADPASMCYLFQQQTMQLGATEMCWCGTSCIVLSLGDKIALVGPNDTQRVDVKARSDGIFINTEDDGLRVLTSESTFFLEFV